MKFVSILSARSSLVLLFFFFNDTATTEIYTLSLHDALPISSRCCGPSGSTPSRYRRGSSGRSSPSPTSRTDRKSTRLNSSHSQISYAVFCLKKKKNHVGRRLSALRLDLRRSHSANVSRCELI